jgi:hypothetical protein
MNPIIPQRTTIIYNYRATFTFVTADAAQARDARAAGLDITHA